jgi:hypothetical protein
VERDADWLLSEITAVLPGSKKDGAKGHHDHENGQ